MNIKIRRGADPDAAETNFQPADQIQAFHEDGALVEFAVAIGVFENQNAILALPFGRADRIGVGFGDPEPAAIIDGEGDRLFHVRFAGEQRRFETGRQASFLSRHLRAKGRRI